jgi:hypothetical protein
MKDGVDRRLAVVYPLSDDGNALHPCFLGGHESAATSVSGKFFFVTFDPMYIREKRTDVAGMNRLSGDAKLMTFVPIVSCVHPSSAKAVRYRVVVAAFDDCTISGDFP